MTKSVGIAFIINAHREGMLLIPALRSARAAREVCAKHDIPVEIILVGDKVDTLTRLICIENSNDLDRLDFVEWGNLGMARAHAVSLSSAPFVCFLDGDDVWQDTWPLRAHQFAQNDDHINCVYHTEVFAGFGTEHFLREQIQTGDDIFHPLHLVSTWHYCNNLFAHRTIFERVPIQPYDHDNGYGSEDWHWSCETLANHIARKSVPETVYFYRMDPTKAGLGKTRGLVLRPSSLFKDKGVLGSYASFSGLADNSDESDISLVGRLRHARLAPPWIFEEADKAIRFDLDIWSLRKRLADLQVATPRLFPSSAYVFSRVASFCGDSDFILVGLDCSCTDSDQLSNIVHALRSFSNTKKLVVLCGDLLTKGVIVNESSGVLFVNYKMIMRADGQDPNALDKAIGNIVSNFDVRTILNVNSEFVDYFLGSHSSLLKSKNVRSARVFFQPLHDVGASYADRRVLEGFNQNSFWYSEIWVVGQDSTDYLMHILKGRDVSVRMVTAGGTDRAVLSILRAAPIPIYRADRSPRVNRTSFSRTSISASDKVDITCVLNMHREGDLACPTLHSLRRTLQYTVSRGVTVEVVIVLDDTDSATQSIIERAIGSSLLGPAARVVEVGHRDLAKARHSGLMDSRGDFVAFFDGDDLYSHNWLLEALATFRNDESEDIVCHPELNLYFGTDHRLFWHPDQIRHKVPPEGLLMENYWTSLSFGRRALYLKVPFAEIDLEQGFGFEDWHWNMETVARGTLHRMAPRTAHFIRLKPGGSLNQASAMRSVVTRPTALVSRLIGVQRESREDYVDHSARDVTIQLSEARKS